MPDLLDGQSVEMKGSAVRPYILKNTGGVYSCTCPAWRNQSIGIERRTCKHLREYRGEQAEADRIGSALPARPEPNADGESSAPGLLLAQTWANDMDLAGWWMSEKLDGVRAYWDGRQFLSRQGNLFYAPDWFVEHLPQTPLDGELWLARKSFQRTVSIVRRQDKSDLWRELAYVVFDAPAIVDVFERRLEYLRETITKKQSPFVRVLEQERCRDLDHLQEELARVDALGGEGLMLRQPGSHYEAGRSATLLKIKRFHDAEARVIGHLPGAGRHKGRLGALDVELPDGTQFSVGTGLSDAERGDPPPIGSVITFRYQELSDRGVPRFPSFVRVRRDLAPVPVSNMSSATAAAPSAPKKPVKTNTNSKESSMIRRFEFVEGSSAKFWEISANGTDVTVRFGRIGTDGQTQTKALADAEAAAKHAGKLIAEKTKKGYAEVAITS
jgi:DNA ligase-1